MLSVLRHTGVSFGRATKITVFNYRHNPIQLIHATNRLYDEKVNVKSTRATDNEPEAERVSHNAAAGGAQVAGCIDSSTINEIIGAFGYPPTIVKFQPQLLKT
jgi:hypothetical protein